MTNRAVELIVFGLVGATATAVYFGVAIVLYAIPPFDAYPASAAFVASLASVLWSYVGHHHFTFGKTGAHQFYLPRFLTISIVLSAMAVCGTHFATQSFGVDYQLATLGVTISYPFASFALNRSWVFGGRKHQGSEGVNQRSPPDFTIMASLLLGRLGFLLLSPTGLSGDAFGYVNVARTIINSGKLPELGVQPRGYSLLIAPFVAADLEIDRAVLIMNAALDVSIIALLLWTARSILPEPGHRRARLLCWFLATIQPFTAQMVTSAYTETPTMFLVFVGSWLLFIPRTFVPKAIGFSFLGTASLLRIDILILNIVASVIYFGLAYRKAFDARAAFLGLFLLSAFPISMMAYQYYSTQEIGLARPEFRQPGYYAWMRKWFAIEKTEHDLFAFDVGSPGWVGFDVANYPSRAFDSTAEREQVGQLLKTWRTAGYVGLIDQGFQQIACDKSQHHLVRSFVVVPLLRMLHYWVNIDGAQTYLRVLPVERPISTLFVAFIIALRLILICFAAVGSYAVWFRPPTPVTEQVILARFATLFVLLRTAELGALGTIAWGGLMEVRYILVVFPFVILLAFWGMRRIVSG